MTLRFYKYQGLGNDFIVIDSDNADAIDPAQAQSWCDRHFGIGADGVLVVSPSGTKGGEARMTVVNADGSRPEMCGNGLRCVALHVARRNAPAHRSFGIETDAGLLQCEVEPAGNGATVTTKIGRAQVLDEVLVDYAGQRRSFRHISTGNPHLVAFDAPMDPATVDQDAPAVSQAIARRANVELARVVRPGVIELVVWERGVGRTLACGTGAAATAAAACASQRTEFGRELEVRLPGGALYITVTEGTLELTVRGPAQWVYTGEAP